MDLMKLVDPGVRKLVAAMNALPGVWTYSSCEGHENPKLGQHAKGEFGVSFDVSRSYRGWRALDVLSRAAMSMAPERVEIVAWDNGYLSFEIHGKDGADADDFARRIRRLAAAARRTAWVGRRPPGSDLGATPPRPVPGGSAARRTHRRAVSASAWACRGR